MRVGRIKRHPVHLLVAKLLPGNAAILRPEQAERCSRVNDGGITGILANDMGSAMCIGNALQLVPLLATVEAGVDAAASAGEDMFRRCLVNCNREYVGVIDHSYVNRFPSFPAVRRLPWEMGSPGVDDLGILG